MKVMKQTAVDWLIGQLYAPCRGIPSHIIEQAKEMEKEQMLNAFEESRLTHPMIGFKHETFKDYYNETFNTNEK
jgi:hypothetical protein